MKKYIVVAAVMVGAVAPVAVMAQADAGATSWRGGHHQVQRDTGWDCKGC